jgi:adenylate cyclase
VLFVDLASFTPLTATMGDQAAAGVLRQSSAAVRGSVTQHPGRVVKQIGDALMLMFPRPEGAIEFGLARDSFVDSEPQFPALHIGAHRTHLAQRKAGGLRRRTNSSRSTSPSWPSYRRGRRAPIFVTPP